MPPITSLPYVISWELLRKIFLIIELLLLPTSLFYSDPSSSFSSSAAGGMWVSTGAIDFPSHFWSFCKISLIIELLHVLQLFYSVPANSYVALTTVSSSSRYWFPFPHLGAFANYLRSSSELLLSQKCYTRILLVPTGTLARVLVSLMRVLHLLGLLVHRRRTALWIHQQLRFFEKSLKSAPYTSTVARYNASEKLQLILRSATRNRLVKTRSFSW